MSAIDDVLWANQDYVRSHPPDTMPGPRRLALVACMDYRIPLDSAFGLKPGDAYVIRNAGGIVTEDVLRSLLIAHHKLGIQEILIVNHTECGLLTFKDDELRTELTQKTGTATIFPGHFHAFTSLEENVRHQIQKLKTHPWMPKHVLVRGCIYDVHTGKLTEVLAY